MWQWGTVELQLKHRRCNKKFLWTSLLSLKEEFIIAKSHSREWKMGTRIVTCLHQKRTQTNMTSQFYINFAIFQPSPCLLFLLPPQTVWTPAGVHQAVSTGVIHCSQSVFSTALPSPAAPRGTSRAGPCISSLIFSIWKTQLVPCTSPASIHIASQLWCISWMLLPLVLS